MRVWIQVLRVAAWGRSLVVVGWLLALKIGLQQVAVKSYHSGDSLLALACWVDLEMLKCSLVMVTIWQIH